MAKRGGEKQKNAAKAQAEAVADKAKEAAQQTMVLVPKTALLALLKQDDNYKRDIDGLTGELREAIGNAVEKKHLDKKAYALLKRFHREKSNEKLASLWNTLLAYMEMAGVLERIASVEALPLGGDGEEGEGEETEEQEETSGAEVVKPRFGGRRAAAEAEGETTH